MMQQKSGQLATAVKKCHAILRKNPRQADALYMLGNCYRQLADFQAAVEQYKKLLAVAPEHPKATAELGQTLRSMGRPADAIPYLQKATSLLPDSSELHCELGDALQDLKQWSQSAACYQAAVRITPSLARGWYAWGCAELGQKEYASAINRFQKTLEIIPDWLEARHNLARALYEVGQVAAAAREFRVCASRTDHPNFRLSFMMLATIVPGDPSADNQSILVTRRQWAQYSLPSMPPRTDSALTGGSTRQRPIRLGYISSFFSGHNWMKPVWGLINNHNREEFEVHLFSDEPSTKIRYGYNPDPRDHFYDITSVPNEAVASLIKQSGIDILIDLNSYSKPGRLPIFALRPAPYIVGWFNLYATSGIPAYDYIIGDDYVVSREEEQFYSEKILRVKGSYLTFEPLFVEEMPDVSPPPSVSTGSITFGSMATQYKITPEVIEAWSRILSASPRSSLIIKNRALDSLHLREILAKCFDEHGINCERIHFEGSAKHFEFLRAYDKVDMALDTFPYNGGTTTIEAIWQGVPVLTFSGDRWVSRTSASILYSAGLSEWVANNLEEYVTRAIDLANSADTPRKLAKQRQTLRTQLLGSSVCDTITFARHMEDIYRQIYERGRVGDESTTYGPRQP